MKEDDLEYENELVYPYVIWIEYDPESDCEKHLYLEDFYQAERVFAETRRQYNCRVEFYEQDYSKCRIKTFATWFGS